MYDRVLLPIDPEAVEASAKAKATALQFALDYGAELHVLCVVPRVGQYAANIFPDDFAARNTDAVKQALAEIGAGLDIPTERLHLHVSSGSVYDQILGLSRKLDVDLIVLAAHHPDLSDYLLGPNAARVVRHADCSVVVVRD